MIDIYSKEFKTLEKATRMNLGINKRVLISPEHVIDLIETIKELLDLNKELDEKLEESLKSKPDFDKWFDDIDPERFGVLSFSNEYV